MGCWMMGRGWRKVETRGRVGLGWRCVLGAWLAVGGGWVYRGGVIRLVTVSCRNGPDGSPTRRS
jgi:hypothetical protein